MIHRQRTRPDLWNDLINLLPEGRDTAGRTGLRALVLLLGSQAGLVQHPLRTSRSPAAAGADLGVRAPQQSPLPRGAAAL